LRCWKPSCEFNKHVLHLAGSVAVFCGSLEKNSTNFLRITLGFCSVHFLQYRDRWAVGALKTYKVKFGKSYPLVLEVGFVATNADDNVIGAELLELFYPRLKRIEG
jgi:hypothetical protein